jgi:hypothetical protein
VLHDDLDDELVVEEAAEDAVEPDELAVPRPEEVRVLAVVGGSALWQSSSRARQNRAVSAIRSIVQGYTEPSRFCLK